MAKRTRQSPIMVSEATHTKAKALANELSSKIGLTVSLGEVVDRALECLKDAHGKGAWLSPREAGPVMEDRLRENILSVVVQVVKAIAPDARPVVSFREGENELNLKWNEVEEPGSWIQWGPGQTIPQAVEAEDKVKN